MPPYILWAFLTFPIFYFAKKFSFRKSNISSSIFIHLVLSIVFGFAHKIASIFITFSIRSLDGVLDRPLSEAMLQAKYVLLGGTIDSIVMYWIIILSLMGWDYYNKFRQNELKASRLETKLALAELDALKMQLHPHFLFNTLHSISTLMHRDIYTADQMLTKLSDLLRITLDSSGRNKVKLYEELDFLKKYLDIQSIRFAEKMKIRMEIDDATLHNEVPNLLLQPIVENSIKYCIEPSEDEQEIFISSKIIKNKIRIVIRDSGNGLPQEFEEGIGLTNTRSRLEHLYPGRYNFKIGNSGIRGTEVIIELPLEENG